MFEHPRNVNSLLGLEDACQDFLRAFNSSRLHHAWLICGNKGMGKATLAYTFAKFLLSNPSKGASSSSIHFDTHNSSTKKIENLSHPDLMVLEADSSDNKSSIKVEDTREIAKFLSLTSAESKYRVVIIDSINDMNTNAANALLKVLEEPSHNVFFFLVCHQLGQILPTIRSRCRILKLTPTTKEVFSTVLRQKFPNFSDTDIDELFELSGGSYGKISMLLDEDKLDVFRMASEIVANEARSKQDIFKLSQLAADDDNWKIISFVIETHLHKKTKNLAILNLGAAEDDMNKLLQTKKLIADSTQFYLDKSHIVTTLLS